jgi:hypothetical protein
MDALGVTWQYEVLEPDIARALRYLPDFWLPESDEDGAWLEIKSGRPTPGEMRVARELKAATGCPVYLAWGWPRWGRFGMGLFTAAGDFWTTHPTYTALALCQLWDVGFGELREGMKG